MEEKGEDINLLLSYIATEINEGKKPLFGQGVVVNGEHILELVERIRVAVKIATGEDEVERAQLKAQELLKQGYERHHQLLDEAIATAEAKELANKIIKDAKIQQNTMIQSTAQNLQAVLKMVLDTVTVTSAKMEATTEEVKNALENAMERVDEKLR